jgi:clan AA aspartic protease (TIGR02281 family)
MMPRKRAVIAVLIFLAALIAIPAQAGMYSWKDEKGTIHFTDDLNKIPEKFRQGDKRFKKYRAARPPSFFPQLKRSIPSSSPPGKVGEEGHVIPLIPSGGGNFLVEVLLNNRVKAVLMVDTGASLLTISDKVAKRMGVRFGSDSPQIPFTTAGGVVWMPMLAVDNLQVGEANADWVEASISDQLGGLDGLLGMSFLGDFRVEMDRARSQMTLRPLGDPGDPEWDGKSALWWKTRFSGYARKINGFKSEALTMEMSGHPMASSVGKMVEFYEDLHSKLDVAASRAGVPMRLRSHP